MVYLATFLAVLCSDLTWHTDHNLTSGIRGPHVY